MANEILKDEIMSDEKLDAVAAGGIFDFIGNQVNAVGNAAKTVGGFYNFINNLIINDEAKRLNLIQPNDETNRL